MSSRGWVERGKFFQEDFAPWPRVGYGPASPDKQASMHSESDLSL